MYHLRTWNSEFRIRLEIFGSNAFLLRISPSDLSNFAGCLNLWQLRRTSRRVGVP